jgi:hypothetical protein
MFFCAASSLYFPDLIVPFALPLVKLVKISAPQFSLENYGIGHPNSGGLGTRIRASEQSKLAAANYWRAWEASLTLVSSDGPPSYWHQFAPFRSKLHHFAPIFSPDRDDYQSSSFASVGVISRLRCLT